MPDSWMEIVLKEQEIVYKGQTWDIWLYLHLYIDYLYIVIKAHIQNSGGKKWIVPLIFERIKPSQKTGETKHWSMRGWFCIW